MSNEKTGTRKVIVFENLTLDGVMQAPGRPDEDTRGNFEHGGWAVPYAAMESAAGATLSDTGPFLFGRRTYEDFYSFWPKQEGNPYGELLANTQKYVVSGTLEEPLPWQNSTLVNGNVPQTIAGLKEQPGKDFLVMGSGELVQTLIAHDLVDLFVLLVHPLILGSGRRLFPDGIPHAKLELLESQTTPSGVVIATYRPTS